MDARPVSRASRAARIAARLLLVSLAAMLPSACGRAPDGAPALPEPTPLAAAIPTAVPPAWLGGAVAVAVPREARWDVVLVDAVGGPARTLLGDLEAVGGLAWSPDGAWLAFGARRDANWDVFRVRRDGSGLQRLTDHPGFDAGPAWSPDGRALAFESARDGNLDVYRLDLPPDAGVPSGAAPSSANAASPAPVPAAIRLTTSSAPAIEPSWAPDGAHVAFSAWQDGRYVVELVALADGARRVLVDAGEDDARAPSFAPDGATLAWLEQDLGRSTLRAADWRDGALGAAGLPVLLPQVDGYAWAPIGHAVAALRRDRRSTGLTLAGTRDRERVTLAELPGGAGPLAWAPLAADPALALHAQPVDARLARAVPLDRPGLTVLEGVDAPGARINAALAADYDALRADVRAATGSDFLGRLSDAWRALSFQGEGSAFFSWHKTGRAFDTQMEFRAGGSSGMVLVREDLGGRTYFRMHLRAGPQDGSVGAPLREAGWSLYARFDGGDAERDGGRRLATIPGGYYADFTAMASRYGWQRIPAITRSSFDWRRDWQAIEYWHYERRDGLTWFEAAQQAYDDDHLADVLDPVELRERGVARSGGRVGIPPGWPPEG